MRGEVRSVLALVQVHLSHTSQSQYAMCTSYERMGKGVGVVDVNVLNTIGPEQDATGMEEGVEIVLGVAGMELIFLLAAAMVLCFALVAKTVLRTH